MPITAVLSRTLHDALGDEAAADLVDWMQQVDTHRVELRELNELQNARFESRFNEQRHEWRAELTTFRMEVHDGFADAKLALAATEAKMDRRFAEIESKMERRFAELRKWSFLFWCGTFAAGLITRWPR